jgi:hypothetical protein
MQTVQSAPDGVEFSFDQDGIAAVQIATLHQKCAQFFVFG